jgi:hypothetical protein
LRRSLAEKGEHAGGYEICEAVLIHAPVGFRV